MSRKLGFGLATSASLLASLWAGVIPIGVLRGKVPDATAGMIFDTVLSVSLPALAAALILIVAASWLFAKGRPLWLWLPLLFAAPPAVLLIQAQLLR